jgi:hypothetical protein
MPWEGLGVAMRGFLRVRRLTAVLAAVAVVGAACDSESLDVGVGSTSTTLSPTTTLLPTTTLSPTTTVAEAIDWRAYVEGALSRVQESYYRPERVDWDAVWEKAWEVLGDTPTQERAHRALLWAMGVMGEPHSFFLSPEAVEAWEAYTLELPPPTGRVVAERIGLLQLPGTDGLGEVAKYYATTLHDLARTASEAGVCGWVIDLRDDTGGDMFPMLLGLGPFLGDGVFLTARGPATGDVVVVRGGATAAQR